MYDGRVLVCGTRAKCRAVFMLGRGSSMFRISGFLARASASARRPKRSRGLFQCCVYVHTSINCKSKIIIAVVGRAGTRTCQYRFMLRCMCCICILPLIVIFALNERNRTRTYERTMFAKPTGGVATGNNVSGWGGSAIKHLWELAFTCKYVTRADRLMPPMVDAISSNQTVEQSGKLNPCISIVNITDLNSIRRNKVLFHHKCERSRCGSWFGGGVNGKQAIKC